MLPCFTLRTSGKYVLLSSGGESVWFSAALVYWTCITDGAYGVQSTKYKVHNSLLYVFSTITNVFVHFSLRKIYSILFYSILFYSILFYSILFYKCLKYWWGAFAVIVHIILSTFWCLCCHCSYHTKYILTSADIFCKLACRHATLPANLANVPKIVLITQK